jgi:hypothetical protein
LKLDGVNYHVADDLRVEVADTTRINFGSDHVAEFTGVGGIAGGISEAGAREFIARDAPVDLGHELLASALG